MIKAKKYDWTDSNMALFGSDTDKKVYIFFILLWNFLVFWTNDLFHHNRFYF